MAKRKLVLYILSGVLAIGIVGIFTWALATGKIKPKADESAYAANISQEELKNSGFAIVQLPPDINSLAVNQLSESTSRGRSADLEETNKKIQDLIDSALIKEQIDNQQSTQDPNNSQQLVDQIVILTDQAGNPILPDAEKARKQGTSLFRAENELTFEYSDDWQGEQLEQLKAAVAAIYPKIKEFYGAPSANNTVTITRDTETQYGGYFVPSLNEIALNCDKNFTISDSYGTLIHEIIHAFHGDYCIWSNPWEEGMTEAAEEIINNKMHNWHYEIGWESTYDVLNFPSWFQTDMYPPYYQGGAAWAKIYYENNNFFKNFNKEYYKDRSNDNGMIQNTLFEVIQQVEGTPIQDWYAQQQIFHSDYQNKGAEIIGMTSPYTFHVVTYDHNRSVNVKLYNFKNELIEQKDLTTSDYGNGYVFFPKLLDLKDNQKIKVVTEANNVVNENYSIIMTGQKGIYGIVTGFNDGQVTAKNLDNPSMMPLTAYIYNGSFDLSEMTAYQGRWELTYQDETGTKTGKRIINKGQGLSYVVLPYQDSSDVAANTSLLNNTQINTYATKVESKYQLSNPLVTYAIAVDKNNSNYSENSKQQNLNVDSILTGLLPASEYDYSIYAFYPDNYMVKSNIFSVKTKEKSLKITNVTPTSGSANIDTNPEIKVTFSAPINQSTGIVKLYNGGIASGMMVVSEVNITKSFDSTGTVMTLSPDQPLEYYTQYAVYISDFKDTNNNEQEGYSYYAQFITQLAPGSEAPQFISIYPAEKQTDIPADAQVKIVINNGLKESEINQNLIKIYEINHKQISGNTTYDAQSKTLIFIPTNPLDYNKQYFISISGLKDSYGNNFIPSYYSYNFTTAVKPGTEKPVIQSIEPAQDSKDVPCNMPLKVNFNVEIDPAGITDQDFPIYKDGKIIKGKATLENNNKTVVFTPDENYRTDGNVTYSVFSSGAKDVNGNCLLSNKSYYWQFTAVNKLIGVTDSDNSQISVEPLKVAADGTTKAKVTVTLKDFQSKPVVGKNVILFTSRQYNENIIQPNDSGGGGLTNSDGVTYGYISSTVAGKSEISAVDITFSDNQIVLNNKATIEFQLPGSEVKLYSKTGSEGNLVSFVTNKPSINGWDSKNDHIYQWVNNKWKEIKIGDIQAGIGYKMTVRQNKTITVSGGTAPVLSLLTRFTKGKNYIGNPINSNISAKDVIIQKSQRVCKNYWFWQKCSWDVKEYSLTQAVNAKIIDKMITYTDLKNSNNLTTTLSQITDNFIFYPYRGYGLNVLEKTDNSNNILEIIFKK